MTVIIKFHIITQKLTDPSKKLYTSSSPHLIIRQYQFITILYYYSQICPTVSSILIYDPAQAQSMYILY